MNVPNDETDLLYAPFLAAWSIFRFARCAFSVSATERARTHERVWSCFSRLDYLFTRNYTLSKSV